jgi:hypothetical protein
VCLVAEGRHTAGRKEMVKSERRSFLEKANQLQMCKLHALYLHFAMFCQRPSNPNFCLLTIKSHSTKTLPLKA